MPWNYRGIGWFVVFTVIVLSSLLLVKPYLPRESGGTASGEEIALPKPRFKGEMIVEEAILRRRSMRDYLPEPLKLEELSQLLWAAQGITSPDGKRAAPSAGATYPFEVFVVAGNVEGLEPGIYKYNPQRHSLMFIKRGDYRDDLERAALDQDWVGNAAVDIVLVAFYGRATEVYGERGVRYVHMEAGHIGENIYLQATALGLGTVAVGAFDDERVSEILGTEGRPLYIFPVGRV
ncbi:nitroreductase [Thermococcus profundus]|uniref:Nitroreductase n=1 Tax=Thermococcus profundus TaxID=49899 RepID=A0A2Z2MJR5_THEPR|nr:SagB/ThcOx family dehydrogenase [Thermococcus profundus]ASJ02671.1 nitroreductase [Thermococcus profundus]